LSAAVLSEGKSLIEHWITSCGKVRGVRVHLDIRCNSHPFKRSTLGHELSLRAQSEDHTVFKVMLVRLTGAASGLLTDDCCPMVILEGHDKILPGRRRERGNPEEEHAIMEGSGRET